MAGRPKGAKDLSPRKSVALELRCTARSKQTGERCGRAAALGSWVCKFHGAMSPRALEAAAQTFEQGLPTAVRRLWDLMASDNPQIAFKAASRWIELSGARAARRSEITVR